MGKRGPQKAPKPTRNWTDAMSSKRASVRVVASTPAVAPVEIDWEQVRVARVQEGLPFPELSRRFGIPEAQIVARSVDESWPIPGAVAEHAIVSQAGGLAKKALEQLEAWKQVNISALLDTMEQLSKLPPLDVETATEEELSKRTRLLKTLQQHETLLHTHVSRGQKLMEMEKAKHEEVRNPASLDFAALNKFLDNMPKSGVLASDAVVIDVTDTNEG